MKTKAYCFLAVLLTAGLFIGCKKRDTVLPNKEPVADAGNALSITLPLDSARLTGTGTDADGSIATYTWSQISGPNLAVIVRPDSAATWTKGLIKGQYSFRLKVVDNKGASATDTVSVLVSAEPVNQPPVANAGNNQAIQLPLDSVRLNGTGTDADGNVATYSWSQIAGPGLSAIARPDSALTWVKALKEGTYSFRLRVTDNKGASGYDTVMVSVSAEPVNQVPVANAGNNQSIQLPLDSVRLIGSGTDADGNVVTYAWNQVSGPGLSTIASPDNATTWVKALKEGTYSFRLRVIDNKGASGYDNVTVTVAAAPIYTHTLTLQPHFNANETLLAVWLSLNNSDPNADELVAAAWTKNSSPIYLRAAFKFDMSGIPANATIESAKLSLFTNYTPLNGNLVDANYGFNNSLYIQRITSPWDKNVTWPNQPSTETTNQLSVPHTPYSFLDLTNVDVTGMVTRMASIANYGFMMKLQNETIYTSRNFCSSKDADYSRHPKLVITYTTTTP